MLHSYKKISIGVTAETIQCSSCLRVLGLSKKKNKYEVFCLDCINNSPKDDVEQPKADNTSNNIQLDVNKSKLNVNNNVAQNDKTNTKGDDLQGKDVAQKGCGKKFMWNKNNDGALYPAECGMGRFHPLCNKCGYEKSEHEEFEEGRFQCPDIEEHCEGEFKSVEDAESEPKLDKMKENEFLEMYCKAPTMDTYNDEIRVQEAMIIAFKEGERHALESKSEVPDGSN